MTAFIYIYCMLFVMNAYIHSLVPHVQKVASLGKQRGAPSAQRVGWLAGWLIGGL